MNEFTTWHKDLIGAKVVEALKKNNFAASYAKNRQEAVEKVIELIDPAAIVGLGGSWTVKELGIDALLAERGHKVLDHGRTNLTPDESMEIRRQQQVCDVFISGTNALTMDGQLVNVDGTGNRVSAMIFGPKKVIIVIGINKVVDDCDSAIRRIELQAAPINNKRLARPNPCTVSGECMNCQGPTRICNVTTILHKRPLGTDIYVVIVGEELGF